MALTDESNGNGFYMPVAPAYGGGNGGFGGGWGSDWWGILLLIALLNGGFGGWGMGGFGGGMLGMGNMLGFGIDFPWLLNGQQGINANTNNGFRDAMINDNITSVRDGINNLSTQLCGCCGDMQMSMANGFAGTAAAISGAQNAISQQLNTNEIANLNRSFAEQTANMQGFNAINASLADVKYTEATEACATRTASATNTRDIIDNQTRGTQAILDKLCQLELDGIKGQLAAAQRENVALQNAVNMATMRESQTEQTAKILAGQTAEVDALYNRLSNCPVPSTPVYGRQPIFTCNNNCGCGVA